MALLLWGFGFVESYVVIICVMLKSYLFLFRINVISSFMGGLISEGRWKAGK